jgi:tripartite-type tricarboxylate transporter receptor subunit TctC
VRVENVAGDSGVAGTNAIAAAVRDGTVLGLGISSAMIGGRLLSRSAKFNPTEDFQWFTILGRYPAAMVVPANAAQSDIAAWVASARETPTPLIYASVGTGSAGHLAGGFLRMAQGARLIHRAVEAPDERYALLNDGKIAALFDDVPNARTAAARLETGSSRSPRQRAYPCFPTRLRSASCGTNPSTRGWVSSARRGSTMRRITGSLPA